MTPDIAQALAIEHREDLLRAACRWDRGRVVRRGGWRRRDRLWAWLGGPRLLRRPVRTEIATCTAVTR